MTWTLRISATARGVEAEAMTAQLDLPDTTLAAFCQRHHIRRLALFGSQARGEQRPDSDVDLLVEFAPGYVPGLALIRMQDERSVLLGGRPVDLVTPKFLSPLIRERVLREVCELYAEG